MMKIKDGCEVITIIRQFHRACEDQEENDMTEFRLPTINELRSLGEHAPFGPKQGRYWSSSPGGFVEFFFNGYITDCNHKGDTLCRVRLVCANETGLLWKDKDEPGFYGWGEAMGKFGGLSKVETENDMIGKPKYKRWVVCAACRSGELIVAGARHFDNVMHSQIAALAPEKMSIQWEQGFIDQHGEFLSREDAHRVATEAGQIIRRCGGDEGRLFSENMY